MTTVEQDKLNMVVGRIQQRPESLFQASTGGLETRKAKITDDLRKCYDARLITDTVGWSTKCEASGTISRSLLVGQADNKQTTDVSQLTDIREEKNQVWPPGYKAQSPSKRQLWRGPINRRTELTTTETKDHGTQPQ